MPVCLDWRGNSCLARGDLRGVGSSFEISPIRSVPDTGSLGRQNSLLLLEKGNWDRPIYIPPEIFVRILDFSKMGGEEGRAPIARREHRSRAQREIKSGGDRFSAKRKLLFQRNIKVRHTGTRAHLCKSRPCRMQNGTSVASPFPNVSQKKREGKHNNGAYGRATSARTRRGFGNRQRRAPTGSPRPPSLHYCFCIILLNVAAERGASGR